MGPGSTQDPRVCCVIVNWNGWPDTLECLASLRQQDYSALDILVVDNGSTNDSVARIRGAFPEVQLLETGKNLGFPSGCNVGLRAALSGEAEFLWLLNNDTVCPPDTLSKLVRRALQTPDAGLIGTVCYYAHDPSQVQAWGGGRLRPWIAYSSHFTAPASFGRDSFLTFASVLARRAMLQQTGLLYEGFFMYYDDADLCQRMQCTAWRIAMAEDTGILHKEGASSGKGENTLKTQIITVSALRFIRRNSRWAIFGIPLYVLLRVGLRFTRGHWGGALAVLRGAMQFLRDPMPS